MKTHLLNLFFLIVLMCGCDVDKKQDSKTASSAIAIKDNEPIDFAAKGMENLNASHNIKNIICQCWENKEDAEYAKGLDASNIEVVYRGYCLFSDGTMIKNPRASMESGKWSFNNNVRPITLNFSLGNGQSESFQLASLAAYSLSLAHKEGDKTKIVDYTSEALRYNDPAKDPFHISNNAWRLKPGRPESDEQIRARLKGCIHFFILFYEEKIDAHSDDISFIGLPSCFKWYGGAIYLQKEKELQAIWVNSFYNREQAMKAYKLADELLSKKYKWPKEGNWLMQNVAVLRQMEEKIDALPD